MHKISIHEYDYDEIKKTLSAPVSGTWTISLSAFLRAVLLVGRQSYFDVLKFSDWSRLELVWRYAALRANMMTEVDAKTGIARLVPTGAFKALDGSEKVMISYLIGCATAKIVAERTCKIRWLMHLDIYSKSNHPYSSPNYTVTMVPGPSRRPDFIGQDSSGQWAVFEAKGRSGGADEAIRMRAKEQTRMLKDINGVPPTWRYATVSQFKPKGLEIDIVDPATARDDAFSMNLPPAMFYFTCYWSVFHFLRDGSEPREVRGRQFQVQYLPDADLTIGLDRNIFNALRDIRQLGAAAADLIAQAVSNLPTGDSTGEGDGFVQSTIGPDGTMIGLGETWRDDQGILFPAPVLAVETESPARLSAEETQTVHVEQYDWARHYYDAVEPDVVRQKLME
jgi:hypothetical protein